MAPNRPFVRACGAAGTGTLAAVVCCTIACTSAPNLPPALGNCESDSALSCGNQNGVSGGASSPADASAAIDADAAGLIVDAEGGACGIQTVLNPTNPACAPCVETSCCSAAAVCAADINCQLVVENCAGCTSASAACAQTCAFTQQSVTVGTASAFGDLAGCVARNCGMPCPALNVFQVVVDP